MQERKKNEVLQQTPRVVLDSHFLSRYKNNGLLKNQFIFSKKKKVEFSSNNFSQNYFNFKGVKKRGLSQNCFSIYVHSTKRNTRISFCKQDGSHIFSYTMGILGYKKSKRGNAFFVKDLCLKFLQDLQKYEISSYILYINGFGRSRRPIINFFSRSKLRYKCLYILDVTPKAHNGCRSRIQRRL